LCKNGCDVCPEDASLVNLLPPIKIKWIEI
jgi:hypothetical protein